MPSGKNIIAIFKKSFFLEELVNFFPNDEFQIKFFKSLKEILKETVQEQILFIDISLDPKLSGLKKIIGSKNTKTKIFVFSKKDLNLESSNKEIHIINVPIILRDFYKLLKQVSQCRKDTFPQTKIGNFVFYPKRSTLINEQKQSEINLTELENKFLKFLIKNKKGSTKNKILQEVWGHNKVLDTHTLESLIYRLRQKIEKNPNKPDFLIQKSKKYFLEN